MQLPEEIVALASALHSDGVADAAAIADAEAALGHVLPDDYRESVRLNDGAEGFIGDTYVSLWPVRELVELNTLARTSEYTPGLTAFGTDGGTEFFGFDRRNGVFAVVEIPVVPLDWSYANRLAENFGDGLRRRLHEADGIEVDADAPAVAVRIDEARGVGRRIEVAVHADRVLGRSRDRIELRVAETPTVGAPDRYCARLGPAQ